MHRPNFIGQLERQLCLLGETILARKIKGKVITDLEDIAIAIGTSLPLASQENALTILSQFRKSYLLAKSFSIEVPLPLP
jgi:hypothetical protein